MKEDTSHINLSRLVKLTKGDEIKMLKYLHQFLDLISPKVIALKVYLVNKNHKKTRELIHHIGPHLIFFGVPDVKEMLELIEEEIEFTLTKELQENIGKLLINIEKATEEINNIVVKKSTKL